ncbi:hypothetical protein ACJIZ3_023250 [Penstemon smallii]|uniref:AP2/ERF domain-containing protein n=1 Tax=Penstemon smallii TaxID=265156 RepID=A0ABD3TNJ4_9LAMI
MARENNWLSFSLSNSMESVPFEADSQNYYSFSDNFYATATTTGWPDQKSQAMNNSSSDDVVFSNYMQPPPKLEDFFTDSAETQESSLTHIYDHHQNGGAAAYFNGGEQQDLKIVNGYRAFSTNSGSEVDNSGFSGQTQSPVESGTEFVAYSNNNNGLSLGVDINNNNININDNVNNNKAIVNVEPESCKKIADTFGQRTSIYRGVTRHRWTGRYEAHLWDNSCRREGQARKGRQGGYDKEEKAARSYDLAALKYWGPSATTNFPITNYSQEMEEMKHATKQEFIASLRRKSSGFSRGASIYRGVTRHHQQGRWQARIGRVAGNKDLYLGTFATEEEAAEAYDIAAIKFRGLNAVTNFEMNRYDVEAIAKSSLPIGGPAKRLKISQESEEKLQLGTPENTISFGSTVPCGVVPFDQSTPFYHHNLFHHHPGGNQGDSDTFAAAMSSTGTPTMTLMPSPTEFFIWPHHHQSNY